MLASWARVCDNAPSRCSVPLCFEHRASTPDAGLINQLYDTNMKIFSTALALLLSLFALPLTSHAQSTQIITEYLMTIYLPTERKAIDPTLTIVNILPGGWVKGPGINGKVIAPGGDWLRTMPSGALRQEARLTIETDDGAFIHMSYVGVVAMSKDAAEALGRGEVLNDKRVPYFINTPLFQTSAEKYSWMNKVQAIGKMVELKRTSTEAYVKYDVFIAR